MLTASQEDGVEVAKKRHLKHIQCLKTACAQKPDTNFNELKKQVSTRVHMERLCLI